MEITVVQKRFLLAGYEMVMDFGKGFDDEMTWIRNELCRCIDRIGSKFEPQRLVGFWQPFQACMTTPDPANQGKAKYFFGVEVANLDEIPSDCVVKAVPMSHYAVCREEHRGTAPKLEMYTLSGYEVNYEIAGDFEIFDDFDHVEVSDPCDVLVPIKPKA